jgi:hypothetical protein
MMDDDTMTGWRSVTSDDGIGTIRAKNVGGSHEC